jgi:hypothetical protein
MSNKIQIGVISMMSAIIIPNGLIYRDCKKSPCINENTALVEPHDGQGTFVTRFIKQISAASFAD